MSQEKIREIISNLYIMADDDLYDAKRPGCFSRTFNFDDKKRIDQALAEINRIVMECVPEEVAVHGFEEDEEQGRIRGYNKAIAEFEANWEGK